MFQQYSRLLDKYPLMAKMLTSGILFSLGDAITQSVIDKKPKMDLKRNATLFLVGSTYCGPLLHWWYCKALPVIGNLLFKETTKKSAKVFTFMSADQLLFTPFYLVGFFIYDGIINRCSASEMKNYLISCKQKMWQTLVINWMVWPIAMTVNFWCIPIFYQVPFVMFLEFFFNIILSYIAYDETPEHTILHHHKK